MVCRINMEHTGNLIQMLIFYVQQLSNYISIGFSWGYMITSALTKSINALTGKVFSQYIDTLKITSELILERNKLPFQNVVIIHTKYCSV